MANHMVGVAVTSIVVASVIFVAAFRFRERPWSVALLCLGALVLGGAWSLDPFLRPWDERYHALVAKNLLRHPWIPTLYDDDLGPHPLEWTKSGVWLHKPPLPLFLIALSFRVLGVSEWAVRVPSVLLVCASVFAVYRMGVIAFNQRAAFLGAFLYAMHGQVLFLASGRTATDHPDSIFGSIVAIGAWAAFVQTRSRKPWQTALVGVLLGLSLLAKWLPGLLVLGIWMVAAWERGRVATFLRDLLVILAIGVVIALPWHLYTHARFPAEAAYEHDYNWAHFTQSLEGHAESPFFHVVRFPELYGLFGVGALLWFARVKVWRERARYAIALLAWIVATYAFFALPKTKMFSYVMPAAPAMCLVMGCAWEALRTAGTSGTKRLRGFAAAAVVVLLTWQIVLLNKVWHPLDPRTERVERAKALKAIARGAGDDVVFVNTRWPIELMFYSGRPAFAEPAGEQLHRVCESRGLRVVDLRGGP